MKLKGWIMGSLDLTYVTEKSIVYLFNLGGVPVVQRLILKFNLFRVLANPTEGG